MANETVVVTISKTGKVEIDAQNFQDNSCSTATHELELVLGGGSQPKKQEKPEYYNPPVSTGQTVKRIF